MRTSVPGIWALGDCNGRGAFTHTAYNDFEIVAANLLDNDPRRVSDRIVAYNLYTDPPLGRVGMTEAEVRKSGRPALMAKMAMEDVSRAFEKGETQGFMKILVDAETKQFLGASILGVGGDEVIHVHPRPHVRQGALCTVMQRAVHIHPTVSELLADHAGRPEAAVRPPPDRTPYGLMRGERASDIRAASVGSPLTASEAGKHAHALVATRGPGAHHQRPWVQIR